MKLHWARLLLQSCRKQITRKSQWSCPLMLQDALKTRVSACSSRLGMTGGSAPHLLINHTTLHCHRVRDIKGPHASDTALLYAHSCQQHLAQTIPFLHVSLFVYRSNSYIKLYREFINWDDSPLPRWLANIHKYLGHYSRCWATNQPKGTGVSEAAFLRPPMFLGRPLPGRLKERDSRPPQNTVGKEGLALGTAKCTVMLRGHSEGKRWRKRWSKGQLRAEAFQGFAAGVSTKHAWSFNQSSSLKRVKQQSSHKASRIYIYIFLNMQEP